MSLLGQIGIFIFIGLLLLGGYSIFQPIIYLGDISFNNPFLQYYNFDFYPVWLPLVDYFIALFSFLSLLLFILILVYIYKERLNKKRENQYLNLIVPLFFKLLYQENTDTNMTQIRYFKLLRKAVNNNLSRRMFLSMIVRVHAQTKGEVHEKTETILQQMLCYDWIKQSLYSPVLIRQIFALHVIAEFHLSQFSKDINYLLRKKNKTLIPEVIITLLQLQINETLLFLSGFPYTIEPWLKNLIIKVVLKSNEKELDYTMLLRNHNPEITSIGITLARINNRKELKAMIKPKVLNDNKLIRNEAALAWLEFADTKSDFMYLIEHFEIFTEKIQKKMIKSIAALSDKQFSINFLKQIVNSKSLPLKIVALISLLSLDLSVVESFIDSEDDLIRKACKQVLDFNI